MPLSSGATSSASVPTATGATRVTGSAAVSATALPPALVAVTRQLSALRSSSAPGV